jgi:protein-arginine kinase activator protein McsA
MNYSDFIEARLFIRCHNCGTEVEIEEHESLGYVSRDSLNSIVEEFIEGGWTINEDSLEWTCHKCG